MRNKCRHCGYENATENSFCDNCKSSINRPRRQEYNGTAPASRRSSDWFYELPLTLRISIAVIAGVAGFYGGKAGMEAIYPKGPTFEQQVQAEQTGVGRHAYKNAAKPTATPAPVDSFEKFKRENNIK